MTDSYKVLYEPMPETVGSLLGSDSTLARDSELKSFVADHLSRSEKAEIEAEGSPRQVEEALVDIARDPRVPPSRRCHCRCR